MQSDRRTITIPSLTASWLPVDIPDSDNLTKHGYIEATDNPETNLAIIHGIMDMEKAEKCISIIKPSEKPVILYAKQSVGTCEPYEYNKHSDDDTCSPANIQSSQSSSWNDADLQLTVHGTMKLPSDISIQPSHSHATPSSAYEPISPVSWLYSPENVPSQGRSVPSQCRNDPGMVFHSHPNECYSTATVQITFSSDQRETATGLHSVTTSDLPEFLPDLLARSSVHLIESYQLENLLIKYQDTFASHQVTLADVIGYNSG